MDILSDFIVDAINKRPDVRLQPDYLNTALYYFLTHKDSESFVIVAEKIKEMNPQLSEDIDVLVDLAEKGRWEVLSNLVEFQTPAGSAL